MEPHLLEKLEEFGLSEKEARVYLASLESGSSSAEHLSKLAGVNRSTTYVQIESLMNKGLMSTHDIGKKTFFSAESPSHLIRLYERRQEKLKEKFRSLEDFIPELSRIHDSSGERPMVRFFEGKEGYVTMRNEVLKSKVKEYYLAMAHDMMSGVLNKEERAEFSRIRGKKNIGGKVLYSKTGNDIVPVSPLHMKRVPIDKFPFESEIYIYGNNVALASLKGTVAGIIIESKAIANSMRSIFDIAWESVDATETV